MNDWPGNSHRERTSFGNLRRGDLMSRVRSTGNKTTELRFASLLRSSKISGWRRNTKLVGRPDFVWRIQKVAVFIDGCFWHGHQCGRSLKPRTNAVEWADKIARNRTRDRKVNRLLRKEGWIVVRIWECSLSKRPRWCVDRVKGTLSLR